MESAGKTLTRLRGMTGIAPEQLARSAWPAAVGARIAAQTEPSSLVRTRLVVDVADAVWQKQLWQLRGQILAKLAEVLGPDMVKELEFRVVAPRRPPARSQAPYADGDRDAALIADPGMRRVYLESRKKAIS